MRCGWTWTIWYLGQGITTKLPDVSVDAKSVSEPIPTPDIRDEHAAILRCILRQYLPDGVRAFVFGSRAHGGARQYSDLDLALEWDRPLGLALIGQIAEALSESDLPYKVDIVDLATAAPAFRARIAANCIALPIDREAG